MKKQAVIRIVEASGVAALGQMLSVACTHVDHEADYQRQKAALYQELAECGDNRRVWVAYEQDEPVAFVELVLKRADNDPDLADDHKIAHAHNLQVRKDRKGRGIGTAMMNHVERVARELGKTRLTLGVDAVNTRARALYDRLGYVVLKKVEGPTTEQDGVYLYKMLATEDDI